jgi:hypothetical protein
MMSKILKNALAFTLLTLSCHQASASSEAETELTLENKKIDIPYVNDAQIFASFNDELPAVINYFTGKSQQELINFYENIYGEALKKETKYKRFTLYFNQDNKNIRVAISQQNHKRQVDIIIE